MIDKNKMVDYLDFWLRDIENTYRIKQSNNIEICDWDQQEIDRKIYIEQKSLIETIKERVEEGFN